VFARPDVDAAEGFLDEKHDGGLLSFRLPIETVRANLNEFMSSLDEVLPDLDSRRPGFILDTCEVAISINGKGQVGFLGTGGEAGGSATLTLTLKRKGSQNG
jgi:hypothetical protein